MEGFKILLGVLVSALPERGG
ncbi:MAG: hypothetical protein QOI19_933, partial [Thermoleophilaceae bacterium]|nr:hypothetical protein [Thermoleophilaceae bacterium]